jgi:hypothetical protein
LSDDISLFHRKRQAGEFAHVFRAAIRFAREQGVTRSFSESPLRRRLQRSAS